MAELKRTQVYLTGEELSALDRRQRGTGTDRSQLIRRAIDREYLGRARLSKADRLSVVRRAAGAWKGRTESGAQYVERLRSGRLGRLHALGRRYLPANPGIDTPDLLLAEVAERQGAELLTTNIKHFRELLPGIRAPYRS